MFNPSADERHEVVNELKAAQVACAPADMLDQYSNQRSVFVVHLVTYCPNCGAEVVE